MEGNRFCAYYGTRAEVPLSSYMKLYPIYCIETNKLDIKSLRKAFVWAAMEDFTELTKFLLVKSNYSFLEITVGKQYPLGSDTYRACIKNNTIEIRNWHTDVDYVMRDNDVPLIKVLNPTSAVRTFLNTQISKLRHEVDLN